MNVLCFNCLSMWKPSNSWLYTRVHSPPLRLKPRLPMLSVQTHQNGSLPISTKSQPGSMTWISRALALMPWMAKWQHTIYWHMWPAYARPKWEQQSQNITDIFPKKIGILVNTKFSKTGSLSTTIWQCHMCGKVHPCVSRKSTMSATLGQPGLSVGLRGQKTKQLVRLGKSHPRWRDFLQVSTATSPHLFVNDHVFGELQCSSH